MASKPKPDSIPTLPPASTNGSYALSASPSLKGATGERARIPPRSQALIYEIQLKELFEKFPQSPSRERAQRCFGILDEIIPMMGTLGSIIKVVKDELYRSVYSKDLTSSGVEPFVERVPYFSAVSRIGEARYEEVAKVNEAIADLVQKMKFREHDLQLLYKKNLTLKQEITDQESRAEQLKNQIAALQDHIASGEKSKVDLKVEHIRAETELKHEIHTLQNSLQQANHIIDKLTVFKATDESNEIDDIIADAAKDKNKQELIIDSRGMVQYDIYQAERLSEQFVEILNFQLDDYETSLSQLKKKREILAGVQSNEEEREQSYRMELEDIITGFKRRVASLLQEQQQLKKHIQGLKVIYANYMGERKEPTVQRMSDDALRKYSSMIQFSTDGGASFVTMKDVAYCAKCGDKTIICPHKSMSTDPIPIPSNSSHVRFIQPPLRLRTTFNKEVFESDLVTRLAEEEEELEPTEDEDANVSTVMKKIWGDFYEARGGVKAKVNRIFPVPRIEAFIQEIYDSRWAFEEEVEMDAESTKTLPKFVDFFYEFMNNRYQLQEVATKAIHDVFTALSMHELFNSNVSMFIKHLAGEADVAWKYLMLAKKLFSKYQNVDALRYRQIIQVMYPSRTKEMYEQMELEFVAFSKNRFSREMVEDHLMHMVLTKIEPNYKFFGRILKKYDYQEVNALSCEDFDECLGQLLPAASIHFKRLRYHVAEQDAKPDAVPIDRLAMVASYISLYCCYLNNWVPQALMYADFEGTGGSGVTTADSPFGRGLGDEVGGDTAEKLQEQVDNLLQAKHHDLHVDQQAVEEEAQKLAKRVEILERMEQPGDDED
ncbi:hypothetical protein HDV00_010282 [Rhizophlyctis rosea]|nr:hypothetical protein HDV00_010282 [Rhizophlyctis rosea]